MQKHIINFLWPNPKVLYACIICLSAMKVSATEVHDAICSANVI